MINGAGVGTHKDMLLCTRRGMPLLRTRTVPVPGIQVAVTHGPSCAGGGGLAQPAIIQGAARVTVGAPPTWTCGFGTVGWAWPPWAHIT